MRISARRGLTPFCWANRRRCCANTVPAPVRRPALAPWSSSTALGRQAAAQKLGVKLELVPATTPEAITAGFAAMARQNVQGVVISLAPLFQQEARRFVDLAAKHRLPAIAAYAEYVEAGGLMSYGNSLADNFRRAATYVDRIFKGAKPGDLPVEQPTTFDLAVNMKTAKALGINVPQSILIQATTVIR